MNVKDLRREEVFSLARQARLMIEDGGNYYLNDMATDKELLAFVRLVQAAMQSPDLINSLMR